MNKYYSYAAVAMIVYSSMGLVVKKLSVGVISAYFFAALFSCIFFTIILLKSKKGFSFLRKRSILIPFLIGLLGVIGNISYFYAFKLTTIANTVFIHYLAPPLVVLFAPFFLKERTNKKVVYSVIISLIGLFIMLRPAEFTFDSSNTIGMVSALLSAFAYAGGVLLIKKGSRYYSSEEMAFSQMMFSVIILLPYILFARPGVAGHDILLLLILGFVYQGVVVLLFFKALHKLAAQNFSIITYLEPVGAVILALIFIKEIPSIFTLIGGTLILVSCFITVKD